MTNNTEIYLASDKGDTVEETGYNNSIVVRKSRPARLIPLKLIL